ncbi:hypothetical protein AACH06_09695 [Ideonella sp. DXS29W]|uniref:Pilus assembly protein n=1 Tax=Ideonella lacteola TaxID=2984193 RepID=A0ABU9BML0_9BURK
MNRKNLRSDQRGQSMAEFLVAMAVLLPLFLAVAYAGRYSDVQQAAVQASRYAAFQTALAPGAQTDNQIEDQMRARFFLHGGRNGGKIQSSDTASGQTGSATSPAWRDLAGGNLLNSPNDVRLTWGTAALSAGPGGQAMDLVVRSAGKRYEPGRVAQVEVTMANKLDLSSNSPSPLKIAAATAAVGNSLNSGGSRSTRDAAATIVPLSKIPSGLNTALDWVFFLFEPYGPELGCIKPDVVPTRRLDGTQNAGGCL